MIYAKLINGAIVYAPRKLSVGDSVVYNPPPEMLVEAGYKPIRYTEPPTVEPGYISVPGWTETVDEIVQIWSEEEKTEFSGDEAMDFLFKGGGG